MENNELKDELESCIDVLQQYNVTCTLTPSKKGNYKYYQSMIAVKDEQGTHFFKKKMPVNKMLPDKLGFKKAMHKTTDRALKFLSEYYNEQLPLCPKITQ